MLVRCAQSRTALAAPPKERGRGYWNTLGMTHVLACQWVGGGEGRAQLRIDQATLIPSRHFY